MSLYTFVLGHCRFKLLPLVKFKDEKIEVSGVVGEAADWSAKKVASTSLDGNGIWYTVWSTWPVKLK